MGSNCMTSTSLGCVYCCQGCNASKLRNTYTFLPPPPSYAVEDVPLNDPSGDCELGSSGVKLVYNCEGLRNFGVYQQAATQASVHFVTTSTGARIPIVWLRHHSTNGTSSLQASDKKMQQPLVLLHSHGNATDIGMMMGPYLELSTRLGVDVVGVEYSGYGLSSSCPSTDSVYSDVEAAYEYVVRQGVPAEHIVAYGQSVGTGPSLGLAAKRPLGGVILHSPMLSGIKVIDPDPYSSCRPSCVFSCFDFFPNDSRIKGLSCPAFVIHGQNDDIIPFYHGHRLSEITPRHHRWPGYFPRGAGHNDIVELDAGRYYSEISAFLQSVVARVAPGADLIPSRPVQIEMSFLGNAPSASRDNHVQSELSFSEPIVGPEDGRYHALRRGGGGAREIRSS